MPLKFCANLSFMFQESSSLLERYILAKKAGFQAVECASPYIHSLEEVLKAKTEAGLDQILINVPTGNLEEGELGYGALIGKEKQFMDGLELSIKYAKKLNCNKIHIMSGIVNGVTEEHHNLYVKNLKKAVSRLEEESIIGLIEPINNYSVPGYYMNDYRRAIDVITRISSSSLKLQLDIFHLQQLRGNLTRNIEEMLPLTGHIQIAQVPRRNEPDTKGEIDYNYVFSLLDSLGYNGWIGLEYKPLTTTEEGLTWMKSIIT